MSYPCDQWLAEGVTCTSDGECFVISGPVSAASQVLRSANGAPWVSETLPSSVTPSGPDDTRIASFYGISNTESNKIIVVGNFSGARVIQRAEDGAWDELIAPVSSTGWDVTNLKTAYAVDGTTFVSAPETCSGLCPNGIGVEVGIYVNRGDGFTSMVLPSHEKDTLINELWGSSETDLFAVGCALDQDEESPTYKYCIRAVLWHFDGCEWSDISGTLPNGVFALNTVHGNAGTVVVAGAKIVAGKRRGVRYASRNDGTWEENVSSMLGVDGKVYVRDSKNYIVGGSTEDAEGNPMLNGAVLNIYSNGGWRSPVGLGETHVKGIALGSGGWYILTDHGVHGVRLYRCGTSQ
jgi:hypothetical protein